MLFTLSWPTISELSGKPIPRLWLSDYDRMPQNVDGEGAPFDLARKRAQTFKRYGMTVAESSPGFAVDNP
jgi:phage terminase large subunit GpA-like protein